MRTHPAHGVGSESPRTARVISVHSIAPAALGSVERVIGTGQEAFNIITSFGKSNAKGCSYCVEHLISATCLDPQRLNFQTQMFSKGTGASDIGAVLQDHAELFATIACSQGVGWK